MTPKRIAFDARYINDRYHGIGRYAFNLLKKMISQAPCYDFVLYRGEDRNTRFQWENILNKPNVSVIEGPRPIYWPHEQLLWPYYIKRDSIDLFHTPYFVVPLLTEIPSIMTVHDMIFDIYPQYMPNAWMRPYYRFLMKYGLEKVSNIVTVSNNTAKELGNYYQYSIDKLVIVHEGVDKEFFPIDNQERLDAVRNKYGLESPFILSVGAHRPHKNFGRLVKAFSFLRKDYPHDLVIVGPLDERFADEVTREVAHFDLTERVVQLNWVPEYDLPALYVLAVAVVLPSLHEGFGLPALEAMACGTPIIAANNSSLPEVLEGAGILVDPYNLEDIADSMRLLIENDKIRMGLSQAGLKRSADFSWDKSAQRVLEIYREIVG